MGLVLLFWIIGSAVFVMGWVLGAMMTSRPSREAGEETERPCGTCLLRQIEAQLTAEPVLATPLWPRP